MQPFTAQVDQHRVWSATMCIAPGCLPDHKVHYQFAMATSCKQAQGIDACTFVAMHTRTCCHVHARRSQLLLSAPCIVAARCHGAVAGKAWGKEGCSVTATRCIHQQHTTTSARARAMANTTASKPARQQGMRVSLHTIHVAVTCGVRPPAPRLVLWLTKAEETAGIICMCSYLRRRTTSTTARAACRSAP